VYGVYMSIRSGRPRLDRVRVIDTAIDLADAHGLEGTSMRNVAEKLDVTPMALYKHIANRSQLVDEMLDRVLEEIASTPPADDWADAVRARILAARRVLVRHPWARDAIESRPLATPAVLAHMDSLMALMFDGGLSPELVHHSMHALSTRMWGFTRDVLPTPKPPDDPEERARAMADFAESYPAIVRMATTSPHAGLACDDDAEFEFALDLLLSGIERLNETNPKMGVDQAGRMLPTEPGLSG